MVTFVESQGGTVYPITIIGVRALCVCVCVSHHGTCMEDRGQLKRLSSHPQDPSQTSKLGCQARQQVPLLAEPSHWP